jgi:uncharacterized membrane protein YgcG
MKSSLLTLSILFFFFINARAQSTREVGGTIIDSTKQSVPGAIVKVVSDKGDSSLTATDPNGKFDFPAVGGTKFTLSIKSIGYQAIRRHYTFDADTKPVVLAPIILKAETNTLATVNIVATEPVVFKEDTTEYKVSEYKVRDNAPIEDVIKKLPGVDVDVNGNITTQGKQITKVRINGKDFMGGDVQSITKNLPADVADNIQIIDDYGDQANLTGVKTGEPDKILNITIRKDKNYGHSLQVTGGDGEDALPQSQGIPDDNRYLTTLNSFIFNGDQQIAVLGSVNNTNVNTFSFGSASSGGGSGFGGGAGGSGGGRGNAARGSQNSGSLTTTQNGITDAHSLGANFRDQWGKHLAVYGSYSFADNTVTTNSTNNQQNLSPLNPSINNQTSTETDKDVNHRFTWNMEYTPDTINYLKITPTFSYASVNTIDNETNTLLRNRPSTNVVDSTVSKYLSNSTATSSAPTYGLNILYNHKFPHRHNFSAYITLSSAVSNQYQNPINDYLVGAATTAPYQIITTYSRTNTIGATLSYLQPVGTYSYLELNYAVNYAATTNNQLTDTSLTIPPNELLLPDSALSTRYNFSFLTNRIGLNYRFIQKKYNYTLGLAVQPAELDGNSLTTGVQTHINTFDVIPTARFVYNFSRSHAFSLNYNGSSSSPSFTQLQPVVNFSNALYPVEGNADLKPQFTNNFSMRYNSFDFASGNILFTNLAFQQISNYITTNTISYPGSFPREKRFENTILTKYLNTPGVGYTSVSGNFVYSKPWEQRKFTLSLTTAIAYTSTVGYLTDVTTTDSLTQKNIAKNLQVTPGLKFRVDLPEVIDAQFLTNYAINRTNNSVVDSLTSGTSNIRTWNIGVNGKNYFTDWTFSYDYTKAINYGYASSLKVTNPNILNVYLERRFLKNNAATIRFSVFDLFNQNTGFTSSQTASSITETRVNRLARYYLGTFTLRLQKFAGKAPNQDPSMHNFRHNGNGSGGGGGPGGGGGGPGGGPGF